MELRTLVSAVAYDTYVQEQLAYDTEWAEYNYGLSAHQTAVANYAIYQEALQVYQHYLVLQ